MTAPTKSGESRRHPLTVWARSGSISGTDLGAVEQPGVPRGAAGKGPPCKGGECCHGFGDVGYRLCGPWCACGDPFGRRGFPENCEPCSVRGRTWRRSYWRRLPVRPVRALRRRVRQIQRSRLDSRPPAWRSATGTGRERSGDLHGLPRRLDDAARQRHRDIHILCEHNADCVSRDGGTTTVVHVIPRQAMTAPFDTSTVDLLGSEPGDDDHDGADPGQ